MAKKVNISVIGMGIMGCVHAQDVMDLINTRLVAICDLDREKADKAAAQWGVRAYYDYRSLLEHPGLEAVIIATPHYDHTPISIEAFRHNIHVLVEKPIAVHTRDARKMIEAFMTAKKKFPELVFSAMFMQRTYGYWLKIRDLIDSGQLGKLVRTTWIITDWFRPQIYYDSGGWRATWAGEGGGVLLNQCPHNLDLYQWLVGMPNLVRGFVTVGKYHHIEVEDEVTAYFEHENGMIGHFITSTAESPGTNRLEIVGENGKLVFENGLLTFFCNQMSMFRFIQEATGIFDKAENEMIELSFDHHGEPGHKLIIENFAKAILKNEKLIAPAVEGIHSVMLCNAIMLSSFLDRKVRIPIDEELYVAKLHELAKQSKFHKTERQAAVSSTDMNKSF